MSNKTETFRTDSSKPLNWALIVGGLTLLAIIVRIPFWNLPVRCDEAAVFLRYRGGGGWAILDFLSRYSSPGRHGFHGLTVALMSLLTGADFPWVRLPAFAAGVLSVPLTFIAMRRSVGRASAAIAALLMAVSHSCVAYSVTARGYTFGICLVLITVWYLGKADGRRQGWYPIAAGMALGAAAYTIHTTIYFAVAVAAWYVWRWLIGTSDRAPLVRAGLSFSCSLAITLVVLFLPIMVRGDFGNVVGYRIGPPLGIADIAVSLPDLFQRVATRIAGGMQPVAILWLAVVIGAVVTIRQRNKAGVLMVMALAVIPLVLLLQRVLPPVRTLNFLLPFAYALAGIGIVAAVKTLQTRCRSLLKIPAHLTASLMGLAMCVALAAALPSLPSHPILRPDRDPGLRDAIHAAARLAGPDEVIFAQSWINALIHYEQWKMGRPANRIVHPRLDVPRALLFWPPHWRENDDVVHLLASYRRDKVLFDDGTTQIVRITRIDDNQQAHSSTRPGNNESEPMPELSQETSQLASLPEE